MDPIPSSQNDSQSTNQSVTKAGDPADPLTSLDAGPNSPTKNAATPSTLISTCVPSTGERIDHFCLVRKLGEGGFGQVWLADDTRLHRQVAIKLPHRSLRPGSTEAKRFFREAETAAQLAHPNLIPVLDAVLRENHAYIVSEYCPGPTLMRWMNDNPNLPSPKLAVSMIAQLASGLSVAHQLGLIHRDIKPSNVLLTEAETESPIPRLTDFGLARAMSDDLETRTGALLGSGPYMSPEQASGKIEDHGPHSDVHALGVLLYELLTRQSPFASDNEMETLRRIISLDPPSIRDLRPTVSRDISAVCQRCLEKAPGRRYRDAGELLGDLQRLLDDQPPLARPVGRLGRLTRWASRNVAIAFLSAVAIIGCFLAIFGLAAYAIASERHAKASLAQANDLRSALRIAKEERTNAITQRSEAVAQRAEAVAQRAEAIKQTNTARQNYTRWQRTSYTSDLAFAFLRFDQSYFGDVRRLLDRQIPAHGETDLRTLEWWILDQQVRQTYELWGQHGSGGSDCRLINDDSTLLTVGENGEIIFWDTATATQQRRLSGFGKQLTSIAVLPGGELVIPGPDWPLLGRSVHVIDPVTGKVKDALLSHPTTIDAIEVSQDGDVIASSSRYQSIRCWFPKQRKSVSIRNKLRNESFALTNNGQRIVTSQRDRHLLQVFDTDTGKVIEQTDVKNMVLKTAGAHQHPWAAYTGISRAGFGLVHADDLSQRVWIDSQSEARLMRFSKNDRFLAVIDRRGDCELFELTVDQDDKSANGTSQVSKAQLPQVRSIARLAGLEGNVSDLEVSRKGDIYAISQDGMVERFSPRQKRILEDVQQLPRADQMFVTADGQNAWSIQHNGNLTRTTIDRPSIDSDADLQPVKISSNVGAASLSRDQARLAVLNQKRLLRVYETDRITGEFQPDRDRVRHFRLNQVGKDARSHKVRFSASGRYIAATVDDNCVAIFDLNDEQSDPICFRSYENDQNCFEFSPDEKLFICAGFNGVEVIEVASDQTNFLNRRLTKVCALAFHPGGKSIMVGDSRGAIHCLDAQTGDAIYHLHGLNSKGEHTPQVADLAFYSDDRLASLTDAAELQFWDLDQRTQLGNLVVNPDELPKAHCREIQWLPEVNQLIVILESPSHNKLFRWSIPR